MTPRDRRAPPAPTPELYNIKDAAIVLGVSRWTVAAMCKRGELQAIPRGRRGWRIPRAAILRWIDAHLVHNKAELKAALDARRRPLLQVTEHGGGLSTPSSISGRA